MHTVEAVVQVFNSSLRSFTTHIQTRGLKTQTHKSDSAGIVNLVSKISVVLWGNYTVQSNFSTCLEIQQNTK